MSITLEQAIRILHPDSEDELTKYDDIITRGEVYEQAQLLACEVMQREVERCSADRISCEGGNGMSELANYSKYNGHVFSYDEWIKEKSYYCHNYYRGFGGEEIFAHSDDDNYTEYSINGVAFAESFTSKGDVLYVFSEFMKGVTL